jgi:phage/plasmid primase-like uncharacterized protein
LIKQEGAMSDAFRAAILATLGYAPEVIEPGRLHRFPTSPRRGDTAGWAKLFADGRAGVFGCHRQGVNETWTARVRMTPAERVAVARELHTAKREREEQQCREWSANAKRNADLWARCIPVQEGDPVHRYLCRRLAVDGFMAPACLRLHPALDYWQEGGRLGPFPTMVAPIAAPDGRTLALHRTYLRDGGATKANVPTPKKLTRSGGPLTGACIRLAQPRAGVLGIAEGIETALAASLASGVPTVAGYCSAAVAGFLWPPGVQRLVIFADADKPGCEAADALRARALRAGLRADVLIPTDNGDDWCDVWARRGAVTIEGPRDEHR